MFLGNCFRIFMVLVIAVGDAAIVSQPKSQLLQNDSKSNTSLSKSGTLLAESASAKIPLPGPSIALSPENVTSESGQAVRPSRAAVTELPKFIKLRAQSGRMMEPSLLAPPPVENLDEVSGRAMGEDEEGGDEMHAVGKSTTYYATKSWSSSDSSAEVAQKSFSNFTNGTKAMFAGSLLPPSLVLTGGKSKAKLVNRTVKVYPGQPIELRGSSKLMGFGQVGGGAQIFSMGAGQPIELRGTSQLAGFGQVGGAPQMKEFTIGAGQPVEFQASAKIPGFGKVGGSIAKITEISLGTGGLLKPATSFGLIGLPQPAQQPAPHYVTQVDDEEVEEEYEDDDDSPDSFQEIGGFAKNKRRKIKKVTKTTTTTTRKKFTKGSQLAVKQTGVLSDNLKIRPSGQNMGQSGRALSKRPSRPPRPSRGRKPGGNSIFPKRKLSKERAMGRNLEDIVVEATSELPPHVVLAAQTGRLFAPSLLAPKPPAPAGPKKESGPKGRSMMGVELKEGTKKPKRKGIVGAGKHKLDYNDDSTEDIPKPKTEKPKNALLAPSMLAPKESKGNGHG